MRQVRCSGGDAGGQDLEIGDDETSFVVNGAIYEVTAQVADDGVRIATYAGMQRAG